MSAMSTVRFVCYTADSNDWADYCVDLLKNVNIDVERIDLNESGQLKRRDSPLAAAARPMKPGATGSEKSDSSIEVLVVLASPGFLRTLTTSPSCRIDNLLPSSSSTSVESQAPGSDASDGAENEGSEMSAVLFLCGTHIADLDLLDSEGKELRVRFPQLNRWVTISHLEPQRLPEEVRRLLSCRKRQCPSQTTDSGASGNVEPRGRKPLSATLSEPRMQSKLPQKLEFQILPMEVRCEEPTMVVISFKEAVADSQDDLQMNVEIHSDDDEASAKASVCFLNLHTVYFWAPAHRAGNATVRVFFRNRDIGSRSIVYQSISLDVNVGVVSILLHQLSSLCDQLVIKKQIPTVNEIDQILSGVFEIEAPPIDVQTVVYERFFEIYRLRGIDASALELPTPIHLAAKYGFNKLASKLIDLPDAWYAYNITNASGQHPEQMARGARHDSLGDVMKKFRKEASGDILAESSNQEDDGQVEESDGNVGDDENMEEYVLPFGMDNLTLEEDFAQIYAVYVTKDSLGDQKENPLDDDNVYVIGDSGAPRIDSSGSDYEEVTSPRAKFLSAPARNVPLPALPKDDQDRGSDDEWYIDMRVNKEDKKLRHAKRIPQPNSKPAANLPKTPARAATAANHPAKETAPEPAQNNRNLVTGATSVMGSGQKELLSILKQVKEEQLTMAEAEILFRQWQMRYQDGKTASFKQKQVQLDQMRAEMKPVEDPSTLTKVLRKTFGIGNAGAKAKEQPLKPATSADDSRQAITKLVKSSSTGLARGAPSFDKRSSASSISSRDSNISRASTTSGIECDAGMLSCVNEDLQTDLSSPPPQVPPRRQLETAAAAAGVANNNGTAEDELYLALQPPPPQVPPRRQVETAAGVANNIGTAEDEMYLALHNNNGTAQDEMYLALQSNEDGSGRRMLTTQKTLPERPSVPQLMSAERRKPSLPTPMISGKVPSLMSSPTPSRRTPLPAVESRGRTEDTSEGYEAMGARNRPPVLPRRM